MRAFILLILAFALIASSHAASAQTQPVAPADPLMSDFYQLYPAGSNRPVHGVVFDEKSGAGGYLRVTGESSDHFVFKLFHARTHGNPLNEKAPSTDDGKFDLFLEQETHCTPECAQTFTAYRNDDPDDLGTLKKIDFKSLYNDAEVEKHVRKFKTTIPPLASGTEKRDYVLWYLISVEKRYIEILWIDQNPGTAEGRVKTYRAGYLEWKNGRFQFLATRSTVQTSHKISKMY